jgi:hypothetical protein
MPDSSGIKRLAACRGHWSKVQKKGCSMFELDVWLAIDADGDYGVGKDQEEACQNYVNDVNDTTVPLRMVQVRLKAAGPRPVIVRGSVPDEQLQECELIAE